MKRRLIFLARLAVAVGIFVVIVFSINLHKLMERFTSLNISLCSILFLIAFLDRVLMAFKWNLLLRVRGISISLWQAIRLYFVGNLLGTFTPAGIGGDAYRIVALSRFKNNEIVASSIIVERAIGLIVILLFAMTLLPFSARYLGADSKHVVRIIISASLLIIPAFILSLNPTIVRALARRLTPLLTIINHKTFSKLYRAYAESRLHLTTLHVFTLLTVIEMFLLITINYLAARALDVGVSFTYFLCVMPLLHLLVRLPVSLHAIGIQEGLFVFFIVAAQYSPSDGIAISLLLRMCQVFVVFLPASIMLMSSPLRFYPSTGPIKDTLVHKTYKQNNPNNFSNCVD